MASDSEIVSASARRAKGLGGRRVLIFAIALAMALFHLYTAGVRQLPGVQQRTIHLSFAMALIFLLFPFKPKSDEAGEGKVSDERRSITWVDIGFVLLSFFIGVYVFGNNSQLSG